MKFLCLAYGDEDGWNSLSANEKQEALAHDEIIRNRGHFMTAVKGEFTRVKNWNNSLDITKRFVDTNSLPLAGFSIIEADNIDEVIGLVSNTPCARAKGYIDIRPFWELGDKNP